MTGSRLKKLTVSDFRSISGRITVPLDANVVLIHGLNGTGKTSLMSAMELALTGELPAMERTDPSYASHLVHYGRDAAEISVNLGLDGVDTAHTIELPNPSGIQSLLSAQSAKFFSERCYLAQSTLGRLLEIYDSPGKGESPLTRFVNDLLKLDRYDALIDGLQPVGDLRNVKKLVPQYRVADEERQAVADGLPALEDSLRLAKARTEELRLAISEALRSISPGLMIPPLPSDDVLRVLVSADRGAELEQLAAHRRDIRVLRARLPEVSTSAREMAAQAERATAEARDAGETWQRVNGQALEQLIAQLRADFPDLPSIASTDPVQAHDFALSRVVAERDRCQRLLVEDELVRERHDSGSRALADAKARLAVITEQMADTAVGDFADLAQALSSLLPHVHGDDCPTCGRNFREVSEETLSAKVVSRIAEFSSQAHQLEALSLARAEATDDATRLAREVDVFAGQLLDQETRAETRERLSRLGAAAERLLAQAGEARRGHEVLANAAAAQDAVAAAHNADQVLSELRSTADRLLIELTGSALDSQVPLLDAVRELDGVLEERQRAATARLALVRDTSDLHRALQRELHEVARQESIVRRQRARLDELQTALAVVDTRREAARELLRVAGRTRTGIVRQVFSESLNQVWRDLFIRLAPAEPYVPAFRLPASLDESVTARLETLHRAGGQGGTPGSMLSSGNLNTAALTLFLALHLTAQPQLPWLLLDDPVQSMDDLHVSQFAALLRTLSKELGRQVVIAVHDRELFDYLELELSPAYETDSLITVELSRPMHGGTLAEPRFRRWHEDPALSIA